MFQCLQVSWASRQLELLLPQWHLVYWRGALRDGTGRAPLPPVDQPHWSTLNHAQKQGTFSCWTPLRKLGVRPLRLLLVSMRAHVWPCCGCVVSRRMRSRGQVLPNCCNTPLSSFSMTRSQTSISPGLTSTSNSKNWLENKTSKSSSTQLTWDYLKASCERHHSTQCRLVHYTAAQGASGKTRGFHC